MLKSATLGKLNGQVCRTNFPSTPYHRIPKLCHINKDVLCSKAQNTVLLKNVQKHIMLRSAEVAMHAENAGQNVTLKINIRTIILKMHNQNLIMLRMHHCYTHAQTQ